MATSTTASVVRRRRAPLPLAGHGVEEHTAPWQLRHGIPLGSQARLRGSDLGREVGQSRLEVQNVRR